MGNLWARFRHKDVRIILLGLDSAGKTTILYRLKLDELVTTIPTIGFNVESIQYKDLHLTAWDIGSRDKIRPLFRHYYKGADAVVFVIDSHDPERLDELNYDVIKPAIGAEELTNAVFLFLANKMDLPETMSTEEISDKLGLRFLKHPWGILPVSAMSGDGLQAALEWLAIRLGSSQVKPRNFAQPQPHPKTITQCRTGSSLSSTSSTATSRLDNSRQGSLPPQKPVILVNSKLFMDTKATPSASSGSFENPSVMSMSQSAASTPASHYSSYTPRRSPASVMNSFSSYSITQSMRDDLTRKKFHSISKSDIRKLSSASLFETPGGRKLSSVSMLDCPSGRKMSSVSLMDSPYRRKNSTSFIIDPPNYRKFSTVSLMDTPHARKFSTVSLGDHQDSQDLPDTVDKRDSTESQDASDKPKMSYLSAAPSAIATPPTSKRKSEDLTYGGGFGSFTPIMANYITNDRDRKDSDTSADSLNLVSPSDHIQPHLKPLGLKKSPFLSNSARYIVNNDAEIDRHLEELHQLLPEKYTNLSARGSIFLPVPSVGVNLEQREEEENSLGCLDPTSPSSVPGLDPSPAKNSISQIKKQYKFSKSKSPRQQSQDSDSSSSSTNGKKTNLDFFCSPVRRSQNHCKNQNRNESNAVVHPSSRGAYCSRAYSAIRCLFFRPTKRELQLETNSISSDEENLDNITCNKMVEIKIDQNVDDGNKE